MDYLELAHGDSVDGLFTDVDGFLMPKEHKT
jgi:hypothetical protein